MQIVLQTLAHIGSFFQLFWYLINMAYLGECGITPYNA